MLWRLVRFLELKAAVDVVVEFDGRLLVALGMKRVSAECSSRNHPALLRVRRSLIEIVGVVVCSGLVKRALFLRGVTCLSSRLPALPRVTVVPRIVSLAGQGAAALLVSLFAAFVANDAGGFRG